MFWSTDSRNENNIGFEWRGTASNGVVMYAYNCCAKSTSALEREQYNDVIPVQALITPACLIPWAQWPVVVKSFRYIKREARN